MTDRFKARIEQLKVELAAGEQQMQQLERRKTDLQATMLRIKGAIQVLEELLAEQELAEKK